MNRTVVVGVVALVSAAAAGALVAEPEAFERVVRPGSVDLEAEYDLSGLTVPVERIHTLLPRDAIPAITMPRFERAENVDWIAPGERVISVEHGGEAVAVPLKILERHEIVNMTVGGEPVAATYCPLCDSASVFSRDVQLPSGPRVLLEFGVSGALYNSNVLMYDKQDMALWSQLGMEAISGPLVGKRLRHLPVKVVPWSQFLRYFPDQKVVSIETGHEIDYDVRPYEAFFESDRLLVPVENVSGALPPKALGLGVMDGFKSYFIPADQIDLGEVFVLKTFKGQLEVARTEAGMEALNSPINVSVAQTFWYSWSAFHPEVEIAWPKGEPEDRPDGEQAGGQADNGGAP